MAAKKAAKAKAAAAKAKGTKKEKKEVPAGNEGGKQPPVMKGQEVQIGDQVVVLPPKKARKVAKGEEIRIGDQVVVLSAPTEAEEDNQPIVASVGSSSKVEEYVAEKLGASPAGEEKKAGNVKPKSGPFNNYLDTL